MRYSEIFYTMYSDHPQIPALHITSEVIVFDVELDLLWISITEDFIDNSILIHFYIGLKPELPTVRFFFSPTICYGASVYMTKRFLR